MRCDTPGYCPWAASTGPHNQADGRGHRHRRVARLRHGLPCPCSAEASRTGGARVARDAGIGSPAKCSAGAAPLGHAQAKKRESGVGHEGEARPPSCAPCVPPGCNQGAPAVPTCMSITRCSRLISWTRCLRNEKVRGSSPLSSTVHDRALTRCDTTTTRESATWSFGLHHVTCPLCGPGGSGGPDRPDRPRFMDGEDRGWWWQSMRPPIHACTVTGSTPRASQRQAAV